MKITYINGALLSSLTSTQVFAILYCVLLYLCLGTGIHSDDYSFLAQVIEDDFAGTFVKVFSSPTLLFSSLAILFDFIQFFCFGYNDIYYDIVKSLIALFAVYSAWLFSKQYLDKRKAFLFAFIFVLYPIHDATNYWTTGTYLLLTGSWVMLSQVLINRNQVYVGLICGFLGAFWSYASPPLFAGLSVLFLMRREYRKFIIFVIPEVLYIAYYFAISKEFDVYDFRTGDLFNPLVVIQQFIFQLGTFLDVAAGPSFWLKLYTSILAITPISFVAGCLLTIILTGISGEASCKNDKCLMISFAAVLVFSLLTLSLTGALPQIAFNLGNRVTYFGSMFLALVVLLLAKRRFTKLLIIFVFSLTVMGLSDHWKSWNVEQKKIIQEISGNQAVNRLSTGNLFVVGNQYSSLSGISHIEFFSTNYPTNAVFKYALPDSKELLVQPLTQYHFVDGGILRDRKFGTVAVLPEEVLIFDSTKNKLIKLPSSELNTYIADRPKVTRHWTQMIDSPLLRNILLILKPSLGYYINNK